MQNKKEQQNKDFDKWNEEKKRIDKTNRKVFGYPREVWWCYLGVNIGSETAGKNENFERPVLIMKVYNKETMLVLPITSKFKNDKFHISLKLIGPEENRTERVVFVKLTQSRVISNKRLVRKLAVIPKREFKLIQEKFRDFT
ncbi:MAG: type II toxin-antitoxin system PemK/MazF family toxin [archaeon]|jgi:mRNA interferase MazF